MLPICTFGHVRRVVLEAAKQYFNVIMGATVGLKCKCCGTVPPTTGSELTVDAYPGLMMALKTQNNLTREQLATFGATSLSPTNFIKVDEIYYKPLVSGGRRSNTDRNAFWVSAAAMLPQDIFKSRGGRAAMRILGVQYRVIKAAGAGAGTGREGAAGAVE